MIYLYLHFLDMFIHYSETLGIVITQKTKNLKLALKFQGNRAGSLARIGHKPPKLTSIIDWNCFRNYVDGKYSKSWANACFNYALKYHGLLINPSELETFSKYKRNNVLKSLIALSKYLGFYRAFKGRIKDYGIRWSTSSSIDSFLRILNSNNKNILRWYQKAINVLNNDCSTYLKFLIISGLRPNEATVATTRNLNFGTIGDGFPVLNPKRCR